MVNLIRDGYTILDSEIHDLQETNKLADLGIVQVEEISYLQCPRTTCERQIVVNQNVPFEIECPQCGKILYPKTSHMHKKYIQKILEKGIFTFLEKKLTALGYVALRNEAENTIEISSNGKKGTILLADYCLNTFLFDSNTDDLVLRIIVDEVQTGNILKGVEGHKFITLEEIIANPHVLKNGIDFLFSKEIPLVYTARTSFETFMTTSDPTGNKFEEFVEKLTNFIQENRTSTNNFMKSLERDQKNIWGSKVVRLGGAGHTDLLQIPLYPYLLELLNSNKNYECKFWLNSELTPERCGAAISHMLRNHKEGVVFFVVGKISPDVWEDAFNSRNDDFKKIVIDKYILLRILNGLNAFQLVN